MRSAWLLGALIACSSGDKPSTSDSGEPITNTGTPPGTTSGTPGGTPTTSVTCPPGATGPEIEATTGCYRGRIAEGVEGFLGIGYAEPPVGSLRWARPVPIAPATAPIDALEIGSPCIQTNGTVDFELAAGEGDEDCLYLNVLRPEGTQPGDDLPILFFVHGGGHVDGHGGAAAMLGSSFHQPPGNPPLFPESPDIVREQHAIVVTVNYRLAQLGWIATPGLTAESADGASGNQGLWDVLTALQWANDNATALGGDPTRLMLYGESAGSVTTCSLLTSPLADGLFTRAMLQSAGCEHIETELDTAPLFVESAHDQGLRLATELGCDSAGTDADVLDCMRGKTATEVMAVMQGQWGSLDLSAESYGPIVDGVLLPEAPSVRIDAGQIAQVPVVIGVNEDEGTLFTTFFPIGGEAAFDAVLSAYALLVNWNATELQDLYDPATNYGGDVGDAYAAFYGDVAFVCPSRTLADKLAVHTDVRTYWWTHENPITAFLGAHHGVEISYAFGTGLDLGDQAVMQDVATSAWASVGTGNPAVTGVGAWPLYGNSVPDGGTWVELSTAPSVMATGPRKTQCDWMDAQPGW